MKNVLNTSKVLMFTVTASVLAGTVYAQSANLWATQCTSSSPASPYECVAQHQVRTDTDQVFFQISIVTREGREGAGLELIGPLGFYIPGGIELYNDQGILFDLSVSRCTSSGCFSEIQVDADDIEALALSSSLNLKLFTNAENTATVAVPIVGLSDSLSLIAQ